VALTEPFIVYLLGYPGVGKYTIGRALAAQTGAVLIDNQMINHPILALFNRGVDLPDGAFDRAAPIRDAVFSTLEEIAPPSLSYVFTNNLEDKPEDIAIYNRLHDIAASRDSAFLPVMLTCAREVQLERVQTEERRGRLKVTDAEWLDEFMTSVPLYSPAGVMTLDTTEATPEESAAAIVERLRG
jgi:shikimate kinase